MNKDLVPFPGGPSFEEVRKIQAITDCHGALSQLATEVLFGVETDEVRDVKNALEELDFCVRHLLAVFDVERKEAA